MTDRVLGVLGGMGPLASAHFMVRLTLLTPAKRDQDHVRALLWSDPHIPDRIAGHIGTGPSPLPAFLRGVELLRSAGCGAIAIPCNTAHGWFEHIAREAQIPVLHIVDAAAAELNRTGMTPGKIGILGTVPTLAMRIYQDRLESQGWTCIEPDMLEMERFVLPAIELVKLNRPADAYPLLVDAVNLLADRGAQAVVLGCTEIPLGIQAGPSAALAIPAVDTIDALARAAIRWAKPDQSAV